MVFVTPHTIRASHRFVVYLDLGGSFLHTAIVFAPPGRTRREAWHRSRCQKVLLDIAVLLRAAILNASGDSLHWVIRFWTRRVIEGVFSFWIIWAAAGAAVEAVACAASQAAVDPLDNLTAETLLTNCTWICVSIQDSILVFRDHLL